MPEHLVSVELNAFENPSLESFGLLFVFTFAISLVVK